jgi:oligogalacturonide lyase
MTVGQTWSAERSEYIDPVTGFLVHRVTNSPESKDTHFYFHDPGWSSDGKWFVFASTRTGSTELMRSDTRSGEITQITEGRSGGGWVSRLSSDVYYASGREIRSVNLDTLSERTIGELPDDMSISGHPTENADGTMVVFGARRNERRGIYKLRVADSVIEAVWETRDNPGHIHCSPTDPDLIMHCDATVTDAEPKQRVWLLSMDGTRHWHPYTQSPQEWLTHESWLGETGRVLVCYYPGGVFDVEPDGSAWRRIAPINVWHAGATTDGTMCVVDTNWTDRGIHLIETETGRLCKLCSTLVSDVGGGTHPHPSFSPDGSRIVFGSERDGSSEIYMVDTAQAIEAKDRWWSGECQWHRW